MSTEYVSKFSYRKYTGSKQSRLKRIWALAEFEMVSTWRKSTLGKVLLIILVIINMLTAVGFITGGNLVLALIPESEYHNYAKGQILNVAEGFFAVVGRLEYGFGWFIIAIIGIAGSGFFADDKQGNVIQVYLSKMTREEYAVGKIIGMLLYSNLFTTMPLLGLSVLYIQGYGLDHFQFLDVYALVIWYGFIVSLILSFLILVLSTIIKKRSYASLTFVLFYFLASIFGSTSARYGDEFLLLLSPSIFMRLLAYTIFGTYDVPFSISEARIEGIKCTLVDGEITNCILPLNNGIGLEYTAVIGITALLVTVLFLFLVYRIHRVTADNI